MKLNKWTAVFFTVALVGTSFTHADEIDKKTIFTVNQSFIVPGALYAHHMSMIPAGTYSIKFIDGRQGAPTVAGIYDEQGPYLLATVIPIATDSTYDFPPRRGAQTDEHNAIEFMPNRTPNGPLVLTHWNYPGAYLGYTFRDKSNP